jgi:hypothetical protein
MLFASHDERNKKNLLEAKRVFVVTGLSWNFPEVFRTFRKTFGNWKVLPGVCQTVLSGGLPVSEQMQETTVFPHIIAAVIW